MPGACALYCLFDEDYWLPYSVRSIYEVVPKIYFLLSRTPWYGPPRVNQSKACIERIPDPLDKFSIYEGDWSKETDQRNFSLGLAQVEGFEYGLIIDADEIYDSGQLAWALAFAASRPEVSCWHARWFTYWKSLHFRIDPPEPYDPPVLVKLGTCGFVETRNPRGPRHELLPPEFCMCHHLSYALPDQRLARKHVAFSGHSQSAPGDWMKNIWQAWDSNPNLTNLHPNNPPQYQHAVRQPRECLPPLLREVYDKGGLL